MLGVIVDSVENNAQQYAMFRELNKLSQKHDCYLFTNRVNTMPIEPNFAILQQIEALSHKGVLIGTSLINSQVVAKSITSSKRYFYVWSPEWMDINGLGTSQLVNVFYNDRMELIARSDSYHALLSNLFKNPERVIYNWDAEELEKLL